MELNFNENIILENERVRLEPLDWKHFEALLPIALRYPDLLQYSPSEFGTEAALKAYFEVSFNLKAQRLRYLFVIFDKTRQAYAGSTTYLNISEANQRLEIGATWIGRDFQRTGLNRNCKFLLMQCAFENLGCERVAFRTDKRNATSRKAIEGVGGIYEGMLRSHTIMPDGYRRDTVCYSVLREEWNGIRDTVFAGYSSY